jgi:hypothetical protein
MISALELQAHGQGCVNAFTAAGATLWHDKSGPPVYGRHQTRKFEVLGQQLRKSEGLWTAELHGATIRETHLAYWIEVLILRYIVR